MIPKTSKAWLWLTLLLIVGGGFSIYRWPTEIKAWLARRGIGGGNDAAVQSAPTETTAAPSTAIASVETAKPPATPPASVASSPPSTHPSASPSVSASHPEPSAAHHTWPSGHEPPASSAQGAPSAAPTVTWSPYKSPTPSSAGSDNPYNPGAPSP